MRKYDIYGIDEALADTEVEVSDAFLANASIDKGVMTLVDEACQAELLKLEGLNALETDAEVYDCGNKQGFLSANLAVGMRDSETKKLIKKLF